MTNTNLKAKSQRLNVNLSFETGEKLMAIRDKVAEEMGFTPSLTQVVEFLIRKYELTINEGN
jgi:hypothetical protein